MNAGPGEILRRKIRLAAPLVGPSAEALWAHPRLREIIPDFLVALHGSVRATIPLLQAAAGIAARQSDGDPICAHLRVYYHKHMDDERDHEEWLLQDLEAIGIERRDVLTRIPEPAIAGMVGAQYYWISHAHPLALLGFFGVLEGNPPSIEHVRAVQHRTSLPPEAFRMLKYHAEADPAHADELYELLDRLPLSNFHTELLGVSALYTLTMLKLFFEGMVAKFSQNLPRPA